MPVSAARRTQRQLDARAGVQADAGRLDRSLQRALLQHGVVMSVGAGPRPQNPADCAPVQGFSTGCILARSRGAAERLGPTPALAAAFAASAHQSACLRRNAGMSDGVERRRRRAARRARPRADHRRLVELLVVDRARPRTPTLSVPVRSTDRLDQLDVRRRAAAARLRRPGPSRPSSRAAGPPSPRRSRCRRSPSRPRR